MRLADQQMHSMPRWSSTDGKKPCDRLPPFRRDGRGLLLDIASDLIPPRTH